MFQNPPDSVIREILSHRRTIAVVGCSPKDYRDSNQIAHLLMRKGNHVIPVNPNHWEILGVPCYGNLRSIPFSVEMVDVFRRSEFVPEVVDQALEIGVRIFWTQLGVYHEEAAQRALDAGVIVIMDRCPAIEYRRLGV